MPSPLEANRRLEEELGHLRLMVDGSHDSISLIDRNYIYRAVNRAYSVARGISPEAMIGRSVSDVWGKETFASVIKLHLDRCFAGETVQHRAGFDFRDNEHRFVDVTYYPCINDQADVMHAVVVTHDITELIQKEQKLEKLAYFDILTALPNRVQFIERLTFGVANAKRTSESLAVFFIDLDNFKTINDLHGHAAGDELLRQVAERLRRNFREVDTIAHPATWYRSAGATINRLGGDEFTLVFPGVKQSRSLALLADRVTDLFAEPFLVGTIELNVTCSVGISVFPNDGDDGETLVKHADLAMYRAKASGKNRHAFYDPKMSEQLQAATYLESRLRKAIETEAFDVHYQPKVDPVSNRVVGCEALARWHDPQLGDVSPGQFIPIAEELGLIHALDLIVMKKACHEIRTLHCNGYRLPVSVNYSSQQFERDDIVCRTVEILNECDFPSELLEIEITESVLIGDFEQTIARLRELRNLDIKVALDDFGTGYSSLTYLIDLPIDLLKLDGTFVGGLEQHSKSVVLESIILMAEKLGLGIVAEGVETKDQLIQLMGIGRPCIQGYYYSKPLPFESFVRYLSASDNACVPAAVSPAP